MQPGNVKNESNDFTVPTTDQLFNMNDLNVAAPAPTTYFMPQMPTNLPQTSSMPITMP